MTGTAVEESSSRAWPYLAGVERSTLRELLIHGPLPRAEIARRLSVSRASLTRATRLLMEHAFIAEREIALRAAMGRPSEMLAVREDQHHFLGVKLTGDAVFAVVTDLRARIAASVEEELRSRAVHDTVGQIADIHARFARDYADIHAVGVCLAGDLATVDGRQVVIESYFLGWKDVPLTDMLGRRLGIPVFADNDVRGLTAAEHWYGAGAGCDSLAVVTVGAGIGFGLVIDGKVVAGHGGRAGQLGHLPIDPTGPPCGRGHAGCASVYLPSERITKTAGAEDYAAAVSAARAGDAQARAAFDAAARALGVIIGTVANALDPEKIVLTGDGLAVMEISPDRVMDAIAGVRLPEDEPVRLVVEPVEFTEWARGGAVVAIRRMLQF
ncbi:ROK family transcriptional regulator [Microbacterium testaceum]|uniref:ROK family transcriptional regulator n=1 Tax=Microbacterium testaceum TaxID=2033 RepID=UPI0034423258